MELHYIKALHLIFMVTWFAGLFYIVRLFVYHREAMDLPEPDKSILVKQYSLMQKRLWYGITWPGMVLTVVFGLWLAGPYFASTIPAWLIVKLALVGGLVLYHLYCHSIFKRFGRGDFYLGSFGLRMLNEVATLFLFAIILTASVLRISFEWRTIAIIIAILAFLLLMAIFAYRRARKK